MKERAYHIAKRYGIQPARCNGPAPHANPEPTFSIHSDGSDEPVYQCRECGNMQGLSRSRILTLVRQIQKQQTY